MDNKGRCIDVVVPGRNEFEICVFEADYDPGAPVLRCPCQVLDYAKR